MDLAQLASLARSPAILRHLGRYREIEAIVANTHAIPRPFALQILLRAMSRGRAAFIADDGGQRSITWGSCLRSGLDLIRDRRTVAPMLAEIEHRLAVLERLPAHRTRTSLPHGPIAHVRTDLWLGIKTGGAIAHTAGIANAFAASGRPTTCIAFEHNPTLSASVGERLIDVPTRFWNEPELPAIAANIDCLPALEAAIEATRPNLIYHRLAAFSFAVAAIARQRGVPLVLEYNGSEAWIAKNWGRAYRHQGLAERIEHAILAAADRIVVVSTPLKNELLARGIEAARIRVVMNGVDTQRFDPGLDKATMRAAWRIPPDSVVIGFIGSFGVWHGVPHLVAAYADMLRGHPELRRTTHLLLIGDGQERAAVQAAIATHSLSDKVTLTGIVPQAEAPEALAAADILVAPHMPNKDASPFFGSPTKLFEYMSMGRCIVAAALDQIGEVLSDGRNAILVPPGDRAALTAALALAASDADLRKRLGDAARADAIGHHDWRKRIKAILD